MGNIIFGNLLSRRVVWIFINGLFSIELIIFHARLSL